MRGSRAHFALPEHTPRVQKTNVQIRSHRQRDPYAVAWACFRWRRIALTVVLLGFVFVGAPLASLAIAPPDFEAAYVMLAVPLALLMIVSLLHLVPPFECPNCDLPFARRTRSELLCPRCCAHCGVERGTLSEHGD